MVLHVVVDVHLIEKIWTFYIVFDAGISYVGAQGCEQRIESENKLQGAKVSIGGSGLFEHAVIKWAYSDLSVCSAEEYVKMRKDHIVRHVNRLFLVAISFSKPPDKLPAINLEGTFLNIVSEFVIFNSWIIKTEFQSVLLIETKDLCAFILSIFRIS